MDAVQFTQLISSLKRLPTETEWVEFKINNTDPNEIGEYISALSNSSALFRQPSGFLVWGIEDKTHKTLGTTFKPKLAKAKGQDLENWLSSHTHPRIDFRFYEGDFEGKSIVLLEIPAAQHTPVRFVDTDFIRVSSAKRKLKDFPEKERVLWELFGEYRFEREVARSNVNSDEVLKILDYPTYFDLTNQPLPSNREAILERLLDERMIIKNAQGTYDITNFGAILFAKSLRSFDRLSRKALRVIIYKGKNKVETIREITGDRGYAIGYENAITVISSLLPANEQIGKAFRQEVKMYPDIAIRELVANTLIHQDFSISGTSPMVEIYSDRIEMTNPGKPLIDVLRFIDHPPRSRNEDIAAFMRRINICEERGSGIDKVIHAIELFQLPPPNFKVSGNNTISILYSDKPLSAMSREERVRASYQHAVLQYVSNERMTNASLRERFNIADQNYPMASKIIKETINARLIKLFDPSVSNKERSYVPVWA
ncbi:MAG TPA: ATP-binding protein [Pyrinomonadaceae bacterium]|jgi:predicted HTH transcriptional regulator